MRAYFISLTILACCLSIQAQPYLTGINNCKTKTGCSANNNHIFRQGTPNQANGARIVFDYIRCSTNLNTGNAVEICINNDPLKPAAQRLHGCEFECQTHSFGWAYLDAEDNIHVGSTACNSCPTPTPTPPPAPTPTPGGGGGGGGDDPPDLCGGDECCGRGTHTECTGGFCEPAVEVCWNSPYTGQQECTTYPQECEPAFCNEVCN